MSTLKATNLQHASAASPAIVLASSGSATAQLSSINDGPIAGTRNRIINGDMRIDQRNAGASVSTLGSFPVDRFWLNFSYDGTINAQRSTVSPSGFSNSLALTVATPDTSLGAGQFYNFRQRIEGFNIVDFGFGTAAAKPIKLSFWVRSSVTGKYAVSFANSSNGRVYPSSYAISAADTWEYKTITITGDTTGTWLTDSSTGIEITFQLALGTNYQGTENVWNTGTVYGPSGLANFVGTNGATFYITGVQLEPGSVATPFERRNYGQELALCQRYFMSLGTVVPSSNAMCFFPVVTRAVPTISGGGTGYSAPNVFTNGMLHAQTTATVQTLSISAEL